MSLRTEQPTCGPVGAGSSTELSRRKPQTKVRKHRLITKGKLTLCFVSRLH